MPRPVFAPVPAVVLAALLTALLAPVPGTTASAAPGHTVTHDCLPSRPDPGGTEPVEICYSLFRPAGASKSRQVPMIMHSHGWGGSRTQDPAAFADYLDSGYGVLSFDQRGFGDSGGHAYVENPDVEGRDVQRLVRMLSRQPWVQQDGRDDPRLGAIGGSYGGGYQFLGAFRHLMDRGNPVFDALAPQITWHDLNESLAPQGVVRGEWALLLSAAGADALPDEVKIALAQGVATGMWPDGSIPGTPNMVAFFERNGPGWHVAQGRRLDIPVLFGQGANDTLFPLRQGLRNWTRALTPKAKRNSLFIGYHGGHVVPGAFPVSNIPNADPCSPRVGRDAGADTFDEVALQFFDETLKRRPRQLRGYGRFHLTTHGGDCTTVSSVQADTPFRVGTVATTAGVGAPTYAEVAEGPLRIAGNIRLDGTMTALGVHNRAFYGLAVGTGPADAQLVQSNLLPANEPQPVLGERRTVTLPSVAVDVPEGQRLFVMATPVSDTFAPMQSRTPGAVVLEDATVRLPVVGN